MINSIDDVLKLVNAGFNAQQIADLAKLETTHAEVKPDEQVQEPKTTEPKEEVKTETPDIKLEEQNKVIESLQAQIAALQAANISANVGESVRQETAETYLSNIFKDFY